MSADRGGIQNRYRVLIRVRLPDQTSDELQLHVVWANSVYDAATTAEIIAKRQDRAEIKRWVGVAEDPSEESQ